MDIQDVLKFGVAFVGLALIIGAVNNLLTGYNLRFNRQGKVFSKG